MGFSGREKLIKDNVHGYIYINEEYFEIIDTALFQRLKNVKQTSYVSLYPSSTHDRFTHSLGTYYLGKQAIEAVWNNSGGQFDFLFSKKGKDEITFTFEMACLLHDVGHAPFSHTGENFYKVKKMDESLEFYEYYKEYIDDQRISNFCYLDGLLINELHKEHLDVDLSKDPVVKNFLEDYSKVLREDSAKPHEKMSALLGLSKLREQIEKISSKSPDGEILFNADLFVRCITGTKYTKTYRDVQDAQRYSFYNAIISLLNSDIIDVDKLDYILRDNYMTGYENTGIDTERLIKAISIVEQGNYCVLVYKKNALSVIENVVRANDSSRRWVQNHPVILYDTYITQKCVSETFKILQDEKGNENNKIFEKFFSIDSLTLEGNEWANGEYVFLASDLDVISLVKKVYYHCKDTHSKEIFKEFFARNERRHPLWKSEAEYKICFEPTGMDVQQKDIFQIINDAVVAIDTCKDKNTGVGEYIFTEETYDQIRAKIPKAGRKLLNAIRAYFQSIGKPMDIVIITTRSFASKMKKLNASSVQVMMPNYNVISEKYIYKYSDLFAVEDTSADKMIFYMYSHHRIDTKDFVKYLFERAEFEA